MLHVVGNTINTFHSDVFIKDFCRSYQCMMRSEWEFEFPPIPFQVHKINFTKRYLKVDGSSHLLQEDIRKLFFGMAGKIQEAEDFTIQLFLVTGRREELNCFSHFTPLSLDMVRVDADLDSINNCRVPELHRVVDGSPVVALGELLGVSPPLITDEDRPRLNPFSDKRNKLICSAFLSDKKIRASSTIVGRASFEDSDNPDLLGYELCTTMILSCVEVTIVDLHYDSGTPKTSFRDIFQHLNGSVDDTLDHGFMGPPSFLGDAEPRNDAGDFVPRAPTLQ